jgi:Curlin associated repeat
MKVFKLSLLAALVASSGVVFAGTVTINQNGTGQVVTNAEQNASDSSVITINQGLTSGQDNTAAAVQTNNVGLNTVSIIQDIDYNDNAVVHQTSSTNATATIKQADGHDNVASIDQVSANNASATINQVSASSNNAAPIGAVHISQDHVTNDVALIQETGSYLGTAQILQSNSSAANGAWVYQSDAYQIGFINQNGSSNSAYISQYGNSSSLPEANTATLTQNGDSNQAYLYNQYNDGLGGRNSTIVDQNANAALASINQFGHDNQITVDQHGNGAQATLWQNGDHLVAMVGQSAVGAVANLTQTGSNNSAVINQH